MVSTSTLDARCKATLATMLANGWDKAGTVYSTTQKVLTPGELSHLLQHGGLALASGVVPTLRRIVVPKANAPGFGVDVAFVLNVDLV
jgi:hypothetical protein